MDKTSREHSPEEDAFIGGRILIAQHAAGQRAGVDAVFLAAACPAREGEGARIVEAGSGSGVVSLLAASHAPDAVATGVEIDPELVALAMRNAARNGMGERARFISGDVTAPFSALAPLGVAANGFDHALANPPFFTAGEVRQPSSDAMRRARVAAPGELDGWIRFLTTCLRAGGTLTLVHRAAALPQTLALLEGRFGGVTVYPLHPRPGEAAHRILVPGAKGSRAPLRLLPGMALHRPDGGFLPEAEAVLRGGARLSLN